MNSLELSPHLPSFTQGFDAGLTRLRPGPAPHLTHLGPYCSSVFFSCTTGGLLAVLLLTCFVFPWDPCASQCFSSSPGFLCLLEIREGDAGARSLSLEVVECFRGNSFFHREAAHCIDVNRALAAFELL